ncbi:MAG: RecQ family ATP-dependent DNA helicase [Candidatus Symbiothrix sp.]|jgi:ATP-dependent DNA helicase RecQ|nr:RecQ family ATP-dependent DNA helicase [Candidatus Symbiothrix sp.]
MSQFHDILKEYWGYDAFRSLQEDIITSVYEGKDTLGLMPTGGGKSLTFQVPTMAMDGICIVVTPLIALMKDQVDNLRKRGIKAAMVHSGMSHQEILVALDNCIFGDYKFLYVSPERLHTELFQAKLLDLNVCMLAIDESHCISQWGYDFRPAYLRIAELREALPDVPVLALTATATPEVVDDIQEKLHFKQKNVFQKSFERKNIAYVVRRTEDKLFEIIRILNSVPGTGIVYVRSRKRTKDIATELQRQGIDADFFHAGLTSDEKNRKQNAWKDGTCRVIVCTNAFGMGIDKPDVRIVIHYELPSSLEEYFQEAGRAGRDEQKSFAVALYNNRDQAQLKKRLPDEFPDKEFIKEVYEKLAYFYQIGMGEGAQTGHNFILEAFCQVYHYNMTQVHSALKLLDLAGYIEYMEETEKRSKLMFTVHRDELYQISLDAELDKLLQVLLRSYTGLFSDYIYISEELLAQRTGLTHHAVYEGLKTLSQQNIIHYIPAKANPTIFYTCDRAELKHLNIPKSVYEMRQKRLKDRLEHVIFYGSSTSMCRSQILMTYFGQKDSAACGHCDVCLAKKNKNPGDKLMTQVINDVRKVCAELGQAASLEELLKQLPDHAEAHVIQALRFLSDQGQISQTGVIAV